MGCTVRDGDPPGHRAAVRHRAGLDRRARGGRRRRAYLYEPDDAVIRSGLVSELAATIGGWLPDPHIAYVSSDGVHSTPLARGFRIVDELPFREKPLKAALQVRRIGTLTVKKRGVDIVPEELIRRLKLKGPNTATVIMTRVLGDGRAYLVERL